ncbi:InlB B-repeat-containing protein [Adhaeribacter terreus]|uniref:Alkaline phosphatase PhoX n=1 Tax=Adhaeribacter terreus TaxID=529703 RepID=A0ABW0E9P0_9BACT
MQELQYKLKSTANKTLNNNNFTGKKLPDYSSPVPILLFFLLCTFLKPETCKAQTQSVTSFNLINASADNIIQPLTSGSVVNLATLPTQKLNVQAVTNPSIVGSVYFTLTGAQSKTRSDESGPHYSLQGDNSGNYSSWTPPLGSYTLTAQPYTGKNRQGTPGTPLTIIFSVINQTQVNLNVTINGSGNVAKNPNQTSYATGSTVTLTATPDPGYQFDGWSGNATGTTNPLTVTMNTTKNITANFSLIPIQYNLNLTINGSGSVSKSPDQATYTSGSTVMLTATPDPGFRFDGWSGDATGTTNPLSVTMSSNKNITATFSALPVQYNLNITVNGSGNVTKSPDQPTYDAGSTVTLTAMPAPGFQFDGWTGDTTETTNPITVKMNSNKNITANFIQIPGQFLLNVSVVGSGNVTKNPDLPSYAPGATVTVTASPSPGFQFDGWSGDTTETANPLTVKMNSNKNITATFSQIPINGYCGPNNSDNIGCFTSVRPVGQTQVITYPTATHRFQLLAKERITPYTTGPAGTIPGNFDFAGYVPINGSSTLGYLSLNHERTPGEVSVLDLNLNATSMLWNVTGTKRISFAPVVVRSERNCSGMVTPWGTVITAEESTSSGDNNNDGYQDVGWLVEIDPATGLIPDYDGNGSRDKLWAMGRMRHENMALMPDRKTAYFTEDGNTKCVYKFVATQAGNLSAGDLFVLDRDNNSLTTGVWIKVPNATKAERNNVSTTAYNLGGTKWNGLEELEISRDGKIYFAETKSGTIWRFKDNGSTISELEPWVTRRFYNINYGSGVQAEDWGVGVDNMAFDGDGNLWVMQDADRANLWVVRPDHTPANPKVELFMTTPFEAEPTGLTFSPDYRYGFISIQNPSSDNTQTITDAAGNAVRFNQDVLIVFANKKYLGSQTATRVDKHLLVSGIKVQPNPFGSITNLSFTLSYAGNYKVELLDMKGSLIKVIDEGLNMDERQHAYEIDGRDLPAGVYLVRLITAQDVTQVKIVLNK